MRKKIVFVAVLAALTAGLAAGCGGDGGGSGGDELTRDEYVSQLNQICADFNAKQEEIGEPQSVEDLAELGPDIVDEFEKALDEARGLNPPAELQEQADRFIELGEQQADLLSQLIEAAEDGDNAKLNEVGSQISPLDEESDRIAEDMGATACAED